MTHAEIYTKFMIEYDKANVTSSYPSLTKNEVATILNKAYLSLISGKVSGNNFRKVPFESDSKSIHDIQQLIETDTCTATSSTISNNEYSYKLPPDCFYTISAIWGSSTAYIISHQVCEKYRQTDSNYPWINNPMCFIQGDEIHVFVDPQKKGIKQLKVTFVKNPKQFKTDSDSVVFELNDQMVEELVSLAIIYATDIVQSSRFSTITQTSQLGS